MRELVVTPRQAQVLDELCEYGETDLVAYRLKISKRSVMTYLSAIMEKNGHPNRLTLALAWDRQKRGKYGQNTIGDVLTEADGKR